MKNLIGYIFCIIIACAIAVMIDGRGGVMIGIILLLALVFSQLVILYERRKINISVGCSQKLLAKGDSFFLQVKLSKKTILPTPFIEIEVKASPQLKADEKTVYKLSVSSIRNYEEIKIPFTAVHAGLSFVEISRVQMVDYIGISKYDIFKAHNDFQRQQIRIMPDIPDTGTQADILKTTSESAGFDDSDEETSESATGSTGMPGYEHRAYVPGDPIKKINWKLSSKRDIFMVRLDEKLAVSSQVFILDCPSFENMSESDFANVDIIIEGCLAMLSMLVSQGFESDFYYYIGKWNCADIKSMADLFDLQEKLSWFTPVTPAERLPAEAMKSGGAVCFTSVDISHERLVADLLENKDLMVVVHENSGFNFSAGNVWTCSKDFEFRKMI